MSMKTIDIRWNDLTRAAKVEIARQFGKTPEQFEKEHNWDVFPMASMDIGCDEWQAGDTMWNYYDSEIEIVKSLLERYGIADRFTLEDVENMLCNAFEGGIGYWACHDNIDSWWKLMMQEYPEDATYEEIAMHALIRGGENRGIELFDNEDEDERWTLTMDKFIFGMKLALEKTGWDGDMWNADAETGDAVVQLGLFGDWVYGCRTI